LAETLFGRGSFHTGRVLKRAVQQCLTELMINYWHNHTKRIDREKRSADQLRETVEKGWEGTNDHPRSKETPDSFVDLSHRSDEGKKLTIEDFRAWLRHVNSLTAILKRRGDQDSLAMLLDQRVRLQEMLAAMGLAKSTQRGARRGSFPFLLSFSFGGEADSVGVCQAYLNHFARRSPSWLPRSMSVCLPFRSKRSSPSLIHVAITLDSTFSQPIAISTSIACPR
jgi:hypothetical protein